MSQFVVLTVSLTTFTQRVIRITETRLDVISADENRIYVIFVREKRLPHAEVVGIFTFSTKFDKGFPLSLFLTFTSRLTKTLLQERKSRRKGLLPIFYKDNDLHVGNVYRLLVNFQRLPRFRGVPRPFSRLLRATNGNSGRNTRNFLHCFR